MEKQKGKKSTSKKTGASAGRSAQTRGRSAETRNNDIEPAKRLIHQIIPYILVVSAIFFTICFILIDMVKNSDAMGIVGSAVNSLLLGLFGFGAFIIPLLLVYLAFVWRKSVDAHQTGYKIFFSVLSVALISSLIHVCVIYGGAENTANLARLWKSGISLTGGGVIGGLVGYLSYVGLHFWGSLIVLLAVIFITVMFLFGMTPDNIALYIKYRRKLREERRNEDPVFVNKPRFTAKEISKPEPAPAARGRKKRTFDVDIEPDISTGASPEDLGLEFTAQDEGTQSDESPVDIEAFDAAVAEVNKPIDDSFATLSGSGIENGIPAEPKFDRKELDDSLDALFGAVGEPGGDESNGADGDADDTPPWEEGSMPKKAESDDDFLTVSKETITDLPAEKPLTGEQVRAEIYPPVSLLKEDRSSKNENHTAELRATAEQLRETLESFKVRTRIVGYSRGPTITRYELQPESGTRVRSIANLVDDISLNLATTGVRIESPIPGKSAVGIEVPNKTASTVYLRSLIESTKFTESKSNITACLGADVAGNPIIFDIAKMPHLLIAGATGMGKSVCINCVIVSLLYKSLPKDVKLLLIDPKKVEFNKYKDIPHLIVPVVSDPKKAAGALVKMVEEMERRFEIIEEVGVRDVKSYNELTASDPDREHLPQIVIIIDELADLMMTTPDDVENAICRLAQKARAAGMHIIIGTQRPSVDVITGLIKANIPSRIAMTVASQVDSRTIIDIAGAEKLIGRGDMLYAPVGAAKPIRVQGAFISDDEVEAVCDFIKTNTGKAEYDAGMVDGIEEAAARLEKPKKGESYENSLAPDDGSDPMLRPAIELAIECGKISTSLIQRRLSLGYGRAAKLIDRMEQLGYVSPQDGQKPREVLITKQMYMEMIVNNDLS